MGSLHFVIQYVASKHTHTYIYIYIYMQLVYKNLTGSSTNHLCACGAKMALKYNFIGCASYTVCMDCKLTLILICLGFSALEPVCKRLFFPAMFYVYY